MADTNVTTTTAANLIPEIWAMDILDEIENNLVMAKLVRRFDDVVADGGDTIHIPQVTGFTAKDKAANTAVTPQANTDSNVTINVTTHKEVSFLLEDIAMKQIKYKSIREVYTKRAGYAIAKAIDTHMLGLAASNAHRVNEAGDALTYADFLAAMLVLDTADVPLEGRSLTIDATGKGDVMTMVDAANHYIFANSQYVNGAPVETGRIGDILGCKVYMSNNVQKSTVASVEAYNYIMFNPEAYGLAVQMGPRIQASYMQNYLGVLVTIDVVYGYNILRDDFAVVLRRTHS